MRILCIMLFLVCCSGKSDEHPVDSGENSSADTGNTDSGEVVQPILPDGFESSLTEAQACSDTFFGAVNPEDTVALTVVWYGLLQAAIDEGPQDHSVSIEDELATVELRIGEKVSINWCTDALEVVPDPKLLRAVAGELRVQASSRASSPEDGGSGSVSLTNLLFQSEVGEELRIEQLEIGPLEIIGGWGG